MLTIQYSARSACLSKRACRKTTSGQSNNLTWRIAAVDGCFNAIWQLTATCPPMRAHWRHLANTIELVHPSAHSSPQPKQRMDRFTRFCTAYSRKYLYFTMGAPIHHNFLSPRKPTTQMALPSVQPCLHRWWQTVPILYNGLPVSPSNVGYGKATQSFDVSTNNFATIKSLSVRSKHLITFKVVHGSTSSVDQLHCGQQSSSIHCSGIPSKDRYTRT